MEQLSKNLMHMGPISDVGVMHFTPINYRQIKKSNFQHKKTFVYNTFILSLNNKDKNVLKFTTALWGGSEGLIRIRFPGLQVDVEVQDREVGWLSSILSVKVVKYVGSKPLYLVLNRFNFVPLKQKRMNWLNCLTLTEVANQAVGFACA